MKEVTRTELVWAGKYDEKGQLHPVERTILPFQVVETVNESKADLWRPRHIIRYSTYLVLIPSIVLLGLWHNPLWWFLSILGAALTLWTPYKRLLPMIADCSLMDKLKAMAWVPIIRVTGDVAKMAGYPVGVWWRLGSLDRGSRGW